MFFSHVFFKGGVKSSDSLETDLGFYPLSRFAVLPKLSNINPTPLKFPEYMLISKNHFKPKWLKTHRRLKNVIVNMEWVPDINALEPLHRSTTEIAATKSKESEERLRNSLLFLVANGGGSNAEQVRIHYVPLSLFPIITYVYSSIKFIYTEV